MGFELQNNNDGTIHLSQSNLGSEVSNDLKSPLSYSSHERSSPSTLSSQHVGDSRTSHIRAHRGLHASTHLLEDSILATDGTTQASTQPASGHFLLHSLPDSNEEFNFGSDPPELLSHREEKNPASDITSVRDLDSTPPYSELDLQENMTSPKPVNEAEIRVGAGLGSDFELPQIDGNGTDSSYQPTPTRRRGKKAPKRPSTSSKANSKTSTKLPSMNNEGPKKPPAKRMQQKKATSEQAATSEGIKPVVNGPKPEAMAQPTSGSASGQASQIDYSDMKTDSSPSHTTTSNSKPFEHIRHTKLKPTARIPKKSFFGKFQDGQSSQGAVKVNRGNDSQLSPNVQPVQQTKQEKASTSMIKSTGPRKFQGYHTRKHTLAEDISPKAKRHKGNEYIDSIGDDVPKKSSKKYELPAVIGGGDPWDLPGSPKKGKYEPKPKSQVLQTSLVMREATAAGPNSKKKRSPAQLENQSKKSMSIQPKSTPLTHPQTSQSLVPAEDASTPMENELGTEPILNDLPSINGKPRLEIVISSDPRSELSMADSPTSMHSPTSSPGLRTDTQSSSKIEPRPVEAISHNEENKMGRAIARSVADHADILGPEQSGKHRTQQTNATIEDDRLGNQKARMAQKELKPVGSLEEVEVRPQINSSKHVPIQSTRTIRPVHQDSYEESPDNHRAGKIIYEDQPTNVPISPEEDHEVGIDPQDMSEYSMDDDEIDLVVPSRDFSHSTTTKFTGRSYGRTPLQELQQPADIPSRMHTAADSEPTVLKPNISPVTGYPKFRDRNLDKQLFMKDKRVNRSMPSRASQQVMSPSSGAENYTKDSENPAAQAPQLHPKSVSFAFDVAKGQNEVEKSQGLHQDRLSELQRRQPDKQLLSSQHDKTAWSRNSFGLAEPRPSYLGVPNESSPKGRNDTQAGKVTSQRSREGKWRAAVDSACSGVVDALHHVSNDLLQHLRTREESLACVVDEYKRNATKIGRELARRQQQERRSASKMYEKKCLELANNYKHLSSGSKTLRADASSKDRTQAYSEWQRQTTHVKLAIHTAKKEMPRA
ncbi:hypothetical protein F5B20DRAFT_596989 [Whalleya microplaca]|nr:hypothetical protein F5B20DRAFT_596989 [Whalleya microplaca]